MRPSMQARVYLRQNLFTLSGEAAHVPAGAAILVGKLAGTDALGVTVKVTTWLDEKGRKLDGGPRTLLVPASKIDHVWIED